MIINFDNIGGGGGGGQYVLPVATANRLGGIKVGSGLTIDNSGVLSTSGGTAPSGDNIKVYDYWDLYSGITYDHNDSGVPQEMIDLASSGTPVYVLYTTQYWTVYMSMIDKTGPNGTIHFAGFAGDRYFSCTLINNESWYMSQVSQSSLGGYKIVDALSAITNPTEGMIATERIGYSEITFQRMYVIDPNDYPDEGHWCIVKDSEGNERDDIYFSYGNFYWAWDAGNDNPGKWITDSERGYIYRSNRDDLNTADSTFDIILLHEGDYIETKDEGVGRIGISAITETYPIPEQPQIYQQNKWTPLYPVFKFEGFSTTAETAEFMTLVRDMVSLGRYPSVYHNDSNTLLNYSYSNNDTIVFQGGKEWNTSYVLYLSTVSAGDNEFNEAGVRFDTNSYSEPGVIRCIWGVDSGGTLNTAGEPHIIDYDEDFARLYLQGAREEGDPPGSLTHMEFRSVYHTLVQNPDSGEDELRDYFVFGGKVFVKNVEYYGVWGMLRDDWQPEILSWTSGATYESQNYPIYTGSTGE